MSSGWPSGRDEAVMRVMYVGIGLDLLRQQRSVSDGPGQTALTLTL